MTATTATPAARVTPGEAGEAAYGKKPGGARRVWLAVAGALVAFMFLAPHLVMLLDSLRTSTDVKRTIHAADAPPGDQASKWIMMHRHRVPLPPAPAPISS